MDKNTQEADIYIKEPDIRFGPFDAADIFWLEKSDVYHRLGDGFSTVEFVIVNKSGKFLFVEAKSSSPRKHEGNEQPFDKFIADLVAKFEDSYQIFLSTVAGRMTSAEMGQNLRRFSPASSQVRFILVIPHHKRDWLSPIRDELRKQLRKITRIWNIDVVVMNEEIAREYHLITSEEGS